MKTSPHNALQDILLLTLRALINSPEIIIADEPTGDLDEVSTRTVLDLLRGYADNGAAVLIVTHEKEALSYADSLYNMSDGVLTAVTMADLK